MEKQEPTITPAAIAESAGRAGSKWSATLPRLGRRALGKGRSAPIGTSPKGNGIWRSSVHPGLIHSTSLAAACLLTYWATTELLTKLHSLSEADDKLGGMWAVIATAFVYRLSYQDSHTAALTRMSATLLSFALCLVYLLVAPFHPWGLALLIGVGAVVLSLLGRADDIVTCSITTAVVLGVAALSPHDAWQQPILRLGDTVVGVAIGLGAAWIAGRLGEGTAP